MNICFVDFLGTVQSVQRCGSSSSSSLKYSSKQSSNEMLSFRGIGTDKSQNTSKVVDVELQCWHLIVLANWPPKSPNIKLDSKDK